MSRRLIVSNSQPGFFKRVFLTEKLNNKTGFGIAAAIAIAFAFALSYNLVLGLTVFAGIVGLFVLAACLVSPEFGFYLNVLFVFAASTLSRFLFKDQVPLGIGSDMIVLTSFVGLFISGGKLKQTSTGFFRIPAVVLYCTILAYLALELFNPMAHSFEGWIEVMRKVVAPFLIVFIVYNSFDNLSKIKRFINVLFVFAVIVGAYGCFQQWHGLTSAEMNWVDSDPMRSRLINIFGEYRKFSLFSGPTEFGIIMAGCTVFYLLISLEERSSRAKIIYIVGALFMLLGMSYSGTRTANAMLLGGAIVFSALTIQRKSTRFFVCIAVLAFLFAMYAPIYSSAALFRFRSTFSSTDDASYNVRETNRQSVQPFIWSHPFGGGLSTTGSMGMKYNAGHPMAGFPTDSSYLNKALESGWIGLILTLTLYFFILRFVVKAYFRSKNQTFKSLFAAFLAFFFATFLAEMTQETVGIFANTVVYFPLLGIAFRLKELSDQELEDQATKTTT
ncbi:MAG: O-antigen ligase family protein [Flavisolibacter sp.]